MRFNYAPILLRFMRRASWRRIYKRQSDFNHSNSTAHLINNALDGTIQNEALEESKSEGKTAMAASVKEAQIRDSLAKNLELLEAGLTFIEKEAKIPSRLGTTGFIDLLAQDNDGRYVLIEVKRTNSAARETLHEILKYLEGVKSHLGLREHEVRVIVASVEWRELLVPFSSFVIQNSSQIDGYQLQIDQKGQVISATSVEPITLQSERILAPWHELRFYHDEESLNEGIESYKKSAAAKKIDSYILIILDTPTDHPNGFHSTKQIANRSILSELAQQPLTSIVPLYKSAIYFAMPQLSKNEYIARLPDDSETLELLDDTEGEEQILMLHEALLDIEPRPTSDFFEIGYAAKFKSRLIEEEKWCVRQILRYGYFRRNGLLTDETIISEIQGAQGTSGQTMTLSFAPHQKSDITEVRRRVNDCLINNAPWREQINFALDELVKSGEKRECYIHVMNHSSAVTTVYLASSRDNGALFIPTYQIRVPKEDTERMYYGVLKYNGGKARSLTQILNEFYEGDAFALLMTLQWGGYEHRDLQITRRLGLRYKTYRADKIKEEPEFFELDDHQWDSCEKINHVTEYFTFLLKHESFRKEVCELYSSHWDGHIVKFD